MNMGMLSKHQFLVQSIEKGLLPRNHIFFSLESVRTVITSSIRNFTFFTLVFLLVFDSYLLAN